MIRLFQRLLLFSGLQKKRLIRSFLAYLVSSFFEMIPIMAILTVLTGILKQLSGDVMPESTIWISLGIMIVSIVGRIVFVNLSANARTLGSFAFGSEKRIEIGECLKRAPMGYFNENRLGDITAAVTTTLGDLEQQSVTIMENVAGGFIHAIVIGVWLMIYEWRIGLISLAGLAVALIVYSFIGKVGRKHAPRRQAAQAGLVTAVLEYVQGMGVVKAFGLAERTGKAVDAAIEESKEANIVLEKAFSKMTALYQTVFKLARAAIRTYLPDGFLKNLRFAEPVTLIHLMNHTAGFEEELLDLRYYSASEEIPFKEVLSAHQPKQVYPPGTVSAYSNYGAALAALIVEEASGQSYKDYIKEHILLPLGMTHTSVGPFWMDVDGLLDHKAKGYSYNGKGFWREDEMHLRTYPAGAMNGTAADLLLFAEWLAKAPGEETQLFKSPETKERLFKETWCSYGANAGLSHGFWQYANHPGILGHEGGTYGFKTQFWVEPEAERAILILTNVMETDYCSAIMEAIIEQDARPLKQEVGSQDLSMLYGDYLPARSAWSYVGKIQARMQIIQISKEGEENLRLKMPLADKDLLYEPVGEYQFYCAETIPEERSLAFSVSDGRVTSMTFRLAHDYVPAGPLNGFAGSFLSLGSYILLTVLWLAILIVLGSKIVCKRSSFQWQRIILPICGLILGAAGIAGMLHWFSLYTIISTELNIVAGIGIAAAICGIFTELSYVVKRKNRASVLTIVLFALQIIAAWMLGFLTIV